MGWQLASGTGYCEVEGELVFLDLRRDKYLALRGADRAAFERLRSGEPNDSDAMSGLIATGLIARKEAGFRLDPTSLAVPAQDLSAHDAAFRPAMAFTAAMALAWAHRVMRPERIAATVEKLAHRKAGIRAARGAQALSDMAASYAACRWAIPIAPRCLIDALALDHILVTRGLVATLVFGVRLRPFAAHCWLQTPDTILSGTAAEALNFTPILVVP